MEEYAKRHGDYDLDRLGLFIEMPYLTYGKWQPKKKPKKLVINPPLYGSGWKSKCANQDGYFEEEYKRIFAGEYKKRKQKKKSGPRIVFVPTGPGKKHSTPNDYFGCFVDEPPERFSPQVIKSKKKGKKNAQVNIVCTNLSSK